MELAVIAAKRSRRYSAIVAATLFFVSIPPSVEMFFQYLLTPSVECETSRPELDPA